MGLFFTNAVIDLKILETKSSVKQRHISMNQKYLCNLLKLKPNGPKVVLEICLTTVIPILIRET